jgi:hypothetical protein
LPADHISSGVLLLPLSRQAFLLWHCFLFQKWWYLFLCSFRLIEKNQKIKDGMIAPRICPGQRLPLCGLHH